MRVADLSRLAAELDGVAERCRDGLLDWRYRGRLVARQLDDSPHRHPCVVRLRDFLLQSFPETFSVPRRFAKHMMIVADLENGNADARRRRYRRLGAAVPHVSQRMGGGSSWDGIIDRPDVSTRAAARSPRTTRAQGGLIMRKLIATVFNYSLDGLLADEGTEFWEFCFDLPENREPDDSAQLDFLQSAYALMGRTAYEAISASMTTATDHPFAPILTAGRKVVFSRTLKTADWANTTIAAGDTAGEIDKPGWRGDGHIVVWGGVSLWRSLMRLDLIDELSCPCSPTLRARARLFDGVPKSYRLDLVSSTASSNGILELRYRRHR